MQDPQAVRHCLDVQYRDSSNLEARSQIYRYSVNAVPWQRWVFDQFDMGSHARVLELGCGPGRLWQENADRIPAGWCLTLTDRSAGMLAEACRRLSVLGQRAAFARADAQALPFIDATFDAVIANHMLYHLTDRPRAFDEIRRVLRPGGRLYAATNGGHDWPELDPLLDRVDPTLVGMARAYAALVALGSAGFSLENGGAQLAPWFADVSVRSREGETCLPDPEPLLTYLRSGVYGTLLTDERLAALRDIVAREIAEHGPLLLTKQTGLFIATMSE